MLTGATNALDITTGRCDYRIGWDRHETNTTGPRMVCVSTARNANPNIFSEGGIKTWGMEQWELSTPPGGLPRFTGSSADYMVGQTLVDGRTGRRVTDPFNS